MILFSIPPSCTHTPRDDVDQIDKKNLEVKDLVGLFL